MRSASVTTTATHVTPSRDNAGTVPTILLAPTVTAVRMGFMGSQTGALTPAVPVPVTGGRVPVLPKRMGPLERFEPLFSFVFEVRTFCENMTFVEKIILQDYLTLHYITPIYIATI